MRRRRAERVVVRAMEEQAVLSWIARRGQDPADAARGGGRPGGSWGSCAPAHPGSRVPRAADGELPAADLGGVPADPGGSLDPTGDSHRRQRPRGSGNRS
ncbi:hypothetical protein GCM10023162_40430 [Klenkia terrae]